MRRNLVCALIAALPLFSQAIEAQRPTQTPEITKSVLQKTDEFEVATIKPHPGSDFSISWGGTPGRFDATNITVKMLVEQAFDLPADQVSGGPAWAEEQHFDVRAKISDARWEEISKLHSEERNRAVQQMTQSLLAERFHLAISHHPKELSVYALVPAKGGAKLRLAGAPSQAPVTGSFLMGMTQNDVPVGALTSFLSGYFRRTIVDGTGLTGRYDINFIVANPEEYTPDAMDSAVLRALEDQLGLKLVSRKEVVDTIVIDHLEQPSEN